MRVLAVLALCCVASNTTGQGLKKQVYMPGYAAAHRYADEDGVKRYNYFINAVAADGRIALATYGGTRIEIIEGNRGHMLPLRLDGQVMTMFFDSKDVLTITTLKSIYRISDDNHVSQFRCPTNHADRAMRFNDGVILSSSLDTPQTFYFFNDGAFLRLDWPSYFSSLEKSISFFDAEEKGGWKGARFLVAESRGYDKLYSIDTASFRPKPIAPIRRKEIASGSVLIQSLSPAGRALVSSPVPGHQLDVFENGEPTGVFTIHREHIGFTNDPTLPMVASAEGNEYKLFSPYHDAGTPIWFESNDRVDGNWVRKEYLYGSWVVPTANKPRRLFPWLKHYPRLFANANSTSIFTVREDEDGRIWVGSYTGNLAVIEGDSARWLPASGNRLWMNGGERVGDKMCLIGEGRAGLFLGNKRGELQQIDWGSTAFYTLNSRDGRFVYFGKSSFEGIWRCTRTSLLSGNPVWEQYGKQHGVMLENILTLTEDRNGRIWFGRGGDGIGVMDPESGTGHTWRVQDSTSPFDAIASLTDSSGWVWMAGTKGLWYYDNQHRQTVPSSFREVTHPLIAEANRLWAMSICRGWLIIAAEDKMLALNLDTFHRTRRFVVRYLNPHEANFTSFTEQNATITTRDSSVWFSTSDELYHWDFGNWLRLPQRKAALKAAISFGDSTYILQANAGFTLAPDQRAFNLDLRITSSDCMPRYYRMALVHEGDTTAWSAIGIRGGWAFQNQRAGSYRLFVQIFEHDGSTSNYVYQLRISQHFYQSLWFWLSVGLCILGLTAAFLSLQRKRAIAMQLARLREAELDTYKAEQEKQLSDLRLVTLSNQFRPHFILNALNTIGSRMHDRPDIESVLSRLGESISLIFNHARKQEVMHPLRDEWALVVSLIQIHKLMYLKKLQTNLPTADELLGIAQIKVPMGVMQIPVENALLHGLSNKETGPWQLDISFSKEGRLLQISITDNGIGRRKAVTLSNATKHGTGTKNQSAIIDILNREHAAGISVHYEDDVFKDNDETFGTRCIISIPFN